MTNVVIQQNSRKLLMMDILMSETCWGHKKWNKNSKWHQVGLLFFNYYNDARSNKYKIHWFISLLYRCIQAGRAARIEMVLLSPVLCTGCSFRYFKYSSCNALDNLLFATACAQTDWAQSCGTTHIYRNATHSTHTNTNNTQMYLQMWPIPKPAIGQAPDPILSTSLPCNRST